MFPYTESFMQKLLALNRGEIAIRIFRAATELGLRTVAIYSKEDKLGLHRFKADESYLIGEGRGPVQAYLDVDGIVALAAEKGVNYIHPGYGFLSENPALPRACEKHGVTFVGPSVEILESLGDKTAARKLAEKAGIPVVPGTEKPVKKVEEAEAIAKKIGFPLIIKAAFGGGGRGMRVVEKASEFSTKLEEARREAGAAFGNDAVFLERYIKRAKHIEVQILGDRHGNIVHLYERDCSVQRRHQKVVEVAPAVGLPERIRKELCDAAVQLARSASYYNAGTVEFLVDADSGEWYFIEVNPRVQVEHTVTEMVTGIDIVRAQIQVAQGHALHGDVMRLPKQEDVRLSGFALQCRVTTEDPENGFTPDYGRISVYRSAAGFGLRLDGGTAYGGAVITPYYDSLLVKVTAWAPTAPEAIRRMDRGLREFRIRGVATNLQFVENVINHPDFAAGTVTTRFIDSTPELTKFTRRRDRATRILRYLGEVTVNGHPDMKGRIKPDLTHAHVVKPKLDTTGPVPLGTRDLLRRMGPQKFAQWMKDEPRALITDTTLRDAHQSLLATRMRTADMLPIAPFYARALPQLFALECWGGATFDVALRFLKEDPWDRLAALRERVPNLLFQMLLRGSNAVGYANYADNVVRHFVQQAAAGGIDLFRVFDSLNWVDNMRVAIDAVRDTGRLCEAAICYTGDLSDPAEGKYTLAYYVGLAKQLEKAGAHILGIKDMAGLLRPAAARALIKALKEEVGLPIHLHTHDTSGIAGAGIACPNDTVAVPVTSGQSTRMR